MIVMIVSNELVARTPQDRAESCKKALQMFASEGTYLRNTEEAILSRNGVNRVAY